MSAIIENISATTISTLNRAVDLSVAFRLKLKHALVRNEHAIIENAEEVGEHDDRLASFTDVAGDSHLHGHAVLHHISRG